LGTLKTLGRWAVDRGIIERNPFADIRPPASSTSRDRVLSDQELAALLVVLDNETYPVGLLVRFLLMTGARRNEVARATWSEFDLDGGTWTLPAARAKNNREHVLPLPADALDLLRSLPRFESSPYVFSFGHGPVANFKFTARLNRAMEAKLGEPVKPWSLHDLRRSLATNLQRLAIRLEVTEAVLGHVSGSRSGIVGVYQRHEYAEEKRQALEAWARRIREIASGEAAATNVFDLAKARG
jgi:integrase